MFLNGLRTRHGSGSGECFDRANLVSPWVSRDLPTFVSQIEFASQAMPLAGGLCSH